MCFKVATSLKRWINSKSYYFYTEKVKYNSRDVARFGYTLLVMATYWITECLPIAVTALIPYVFYPLFGIRKSSDVAKNYMKNTNFLLLGGLMVAIAIEVIIRIPKNISSNSR